MNAWVQSGLGRLVGVSRLLSRAILYSGDGMG